MSNPLEELKERLAQVSDLWAAAALLNWDQQVNMPPGGSEARAHHLSTIESLAHGLFVSDETGELLEKAAEAVADLDYDSDEASLVRVTRREYEKLRPVPDSLVAERSRVTSRALDAWQQAREASNFAQFEPHLQQIMELTIEYAEALGYEDCVYDALLDRYEPEMKTSQVGVLFEDVKAGLIPLVRQITARPQGLDDVFDRPFDEQAQWDFGAKVLSDLGFDFTRGRQDRSAHPFTTSLSPNDVRLTTRIRPEDFRTALFATIHEGGHALYDQGIRVDLDRTPLRDGASSAFHEAQARLWENIVGRSRGFWRHYLPQLRGLFAEQLTGLDLETFYRAINRVEPSLIRVEADEVTYNLHIFLRFELEQNLLEGRLAVADLPEVWNAKMAGYLGIRPPDDAVGVLQDVHWSMGLIGYFPSYALGNLLAAQLYSQALAEVPQLPEQIAQGEFQPLLAWLREGIYQHGSKFRPAELVKRVTGEPMQAQPFLSYLQEKYGAIYGLVA
ncbi:MAG: carboxypeptidase M32 [Anaerolineae bacterium]